MAEFVYRGDSFPVQATVLDQVSGAAVDVSGALITWALSAAPGAPILLSKTVGAGIEVEGVGNNVIVVTVDAGDTDTFLGSYYHEIQIEDGIGQVFTVLQERLIIKPESIR